MYSTYQLWKFSDESGAQVLRKAISMLPAEHQELADEIAALAFSSGCVRASGDIMRAVKASTQGGGSIQ